MFKDSQGNEFCVTFYVSYDPTGGAHPRVEFAPHNPELLTATYSGGRLLGPQSEFTAHRLLREIMAALATAETPEVALEILAANGYELW